MEMYGELQVTELQGGSIFTGEYWVLTNIPGIIAESIDRL